MSVYLDRSSIVIQRAGRCQQALPTVEAVVYIDLVQFSKVNILATLNQDIFIRDTFCANNVTKPTINDKIPLRTGIK
jgi:hypothetical protein